MYKLDVCVCVYACACAHLCVHGFSQKSLFITSDVAILVYMLGVLCDNGRAVIIVGLVEGVIYI